MEILLRGRPCSVLRPSISSTGGKMAYHRGCRWGRHGKDMGPLGEGVDGVQQLGIVLRLREDEFPLIARNMSTARLRRIPRGGRRRRRCRRESRAGADLRLGGMRMARVAEKVREERKSRPDGRALWPRRRRGGHRLRRMLIKVLRHVLVVIIITIGICTENTAEAAIDMCERREKTIQVGCM